MRRVRTLVAGTALGFAALTLAVPSAYADAAPAPHDKSSSESDGGYWEATKGDDGKKEDGKKEEHGKEEHGKGEHPHGGPHAGIGILDDGAGLATGAALIAGGLGFGAYALRRRPTSGAAAQA
ncbi:hypothetical protein [Yinghuangia seranimata]|uniref:hypothetical protein n=1 Tax=Yinghuangia seranimata TaxID=408067 RepID=UPI00248BABA8|nr:hypothetical protein [Yinghuangia seranimata]MDI2129000.1 hypothetical protein [Yinghuangia seranimata]